MLRGCIHCSVQKTSAPKETNVCMSVCCSDASCLWFFGFKRCRFIFRSKPNWKVWRRKECIQITFSKVDMVMMELQRGKKRERSKKQAEKKVLCIVFPSHPAVSPKKFAFFQTPPARPLSSDPARSPLSKGRTLD